MPRPLPAAFFCLALCAPCIHAQTISGHVSLSDTNGPARFAHVLLKRLPDTTAAKLNHAAEPDPLESLFSGDKSGNDKGGNDKGDKKKSTDPDTRAAAASFSKIFASLGDVLSSATVSPTGDYTLTAIKPGTYYVHAVLPGYIDPLAAFTAEDLASPDPAIQKRIRAAVPTISILGTETARLDLRLELGASISGRILFEDGSPAAGWKVSAIPYTGLKAAPEPSATLGLSSADMPGMTDMLFQTTHVTDDRGSFRLAGLAPGPYLIRAVLTAGNASAGTALASGTMHLTVFSGNTTRAEDAKPVTVAAQEDRKGEDLTMPLSRLHTISGTVSAKLDGKTANSGMVQLREDDDTSISQLQVANIQSDGTFHFDYVSSGHYTLKIKQAEVTEATGKSKKIFGMDVPDNKTLRSFAPAEQKAVITNGDVANLTFSLEDVPVKAKKDE